MFKKNIVLFFCITSSLVAQDLDVVFLEQQCRDIFFIKRPQNDYDFSTIENANSQININLHDQISIKSDKCTYEYCGMIRFDDGIKVEYYAENNNNTVFTITANKAFFDLKKKVWLFYDYVNIQTFDNDKKIMYTDCLYYIQDEGILFNNSYIKIISSKFNITGDGITSKDKMSYYKILSPKIIYYNYKQT